VTQKFQRILNIYSHINQPPKIEERSSAILVDDDAFFMLEDTPAVFA